MRNVIQSRGFRLLVRSKELYILSATGKHTLALEVVSSSSFCASRISTDCDHRSCTPRSSCKLSVGNLRTANLDVITGDRTAVTERPQAYTSALCSKPQQRTCRTKVRMPRAMNGGGIRIIMQKPFNITGEHSKQDQRMLVKKVNYKDFCVYRRSYLG